MKIVAAYLLAVLGGNASPSADDISNILASGSYIYIYSLRLHIAGKDITELIAAGREKLCTVPSGGGVAAPSGGGGGAPAAAAEAKKEEKVEEKEESEGEVSCILRA
ncbi:60S acidic ribosomal protein P2A-like [Salvia splendens]|uniref:60S acidic ribosomal protein P2A-like n=1 Tax=Salvia splendens TaxID=180675 RepID=UPI001C2794AA|nr:60S acidic ribosomal protein P2A-like [Salvia splendens]